MIRRADELRWERVSAHEAVEMLDGAHDLVAGNRDPEQDEAMRRHVERWTLIAAEGGMKVVDHVGDALTSLPQSEYDARIDRSSYSAVFITFTTRNDEVWWYEDAFWTSDEEIEADGVETYTRSLHLERADTFSVAVRVQAADQVALVQDEWFFATADRHRRKAEDDFHAATDDEQRLAALLLLNTLYGWQIDDVGDLVDTLAGDDEATPADRDEAHAWLNAWFEEVKERRLSYAEQQNVLVDSIGRERAQELADAQSDVLEAIKQEARDVALEHLNRARVAAGLPRTTLEERGWAPTPSAPTAGDVKTCPDCAEEVKAAARKCRFCGYVFTPDEEEQRPRGRVVDL